MTTQLVKYEKARSALAEAHSFDEVKDIRDKAEAMAAYARQAKDTELIEFATEIKVRAERRCGEMLHAAAKTGERATKQKHKGSMSDAATCPPSLADLGITRDQSSRYQQLAAMPEKHFEAAVATAKATVGQVTSAYMMRAAKPKARSTPRPKSKPNKSRQNLLDRMNAMADAGNTSLLLIHARYLIDTIRRRDAAFSDEELSALNELRVVLSTFNS